jgi:hypothetical protein
VIRPRDGGFNPERLKLARLRQIAMTRTILLNCIEPFLRSTDITMGDEVPVYSRASHSRTAVAVVALLMATASAVACEFRAAEASSEDFPTVQALRDDMGRMVAERSNGRHETSDNVEPYRFAGLALYNSGVSSIDNRVRPVRPIADPGGLRLRLQQSELMAGTYAAQRNPAALQPIERIREVE